MSYAAGCHIGGTVLFIRDNSIIGEGIVKETLRYEHTGKVIAVVIVTDEAAKKLIAQTIAMKTFSTLGISDSVLLGFCYESGEYITSGFSPTWESELSKIFKDIKIVSKTDLQHGTVPDSFKNVPGYNTESKCQAV